ncbi:MAG: hypothetical protein J2P17_23030, partial [Mycobacterium sp.]|nr:hypothetical protein [Mycobacterium sp.]
MNLERVRARGRALHEELQSKQADVDAGRLDHAEFKAWLAGADREAQELAKLNAAYQKASQMGNQYMAASEAAFGASEANPSSLPSGAVPGSPAPGSRIVPTSPMDLTPTDLKNLWQAVEHRTPYSVDIKPKSFTDSVRTKAAVFESGIGGSFSGQLPPVMSPYAVGIGYEPTRLASLLP